MLDDRKDTLLPLNRPAVKKSSARIPRACDRRNSAQPGASLRGAGPMPAFLRICQTVDGATPMPSPASSPWIRWYPHDSFSRASRSTTDRTLRCVAGRPERPRRDRRAHRRRTTSRCHRKIVPGESRSAHRREALDRQRPGQQGQPRPVRPRQPRMSSRPLTLGDSELVPQHQDLGVLPARLPARQAQLRHRTGHDQEDQFQAHKPQIIARPGRPRAASHIPDAGPSRLHPADASTQVSHHPVRAVAAADEPNVFCHQYFPSGAARHRRAPPRAPRHWRRTRPR